MSNVVTSIGVTVPAPPAPVASAANVQGNGLPLPVAGVTPVTPVPGASPSGNGTPSGGQPLPAPAPAPAAQPELIQLQAVVEGVNRFLRDSQRQMVFQYDPQSDKESVTIINPATGEVIRQIPSAQVLATAQTLQQAGILMPGLFINESA
jgi:FlaG protein